MSENLGSTPRASPSPSRGIVPRKISERYHLCRRLGSGSVGTVYLADDEVRGCQVALKVIRTERLTPEEVGNLQREFRAIASLNHPRIATAYDFGYTEDRLPFYTREYVPGLPLPPGPPEADEPREFLRPILDLLDAVGYLHDNEILHLDIHAGNLIVSKTRDRRGGVLIDFGFTRSAGDLTLMLPESSWPGGPPELARRDKASPRTDIFLAGRLLYFRLTGRLEGEVELPREIPGWGPRLTLELERIASKAVQQDPDQRFRSAREFREALSSALGESEDSVSSHEPREIFLGRDRELGEVERRLHEVASGKPAMLAITGQAGQGKSRLLEETRLRAQLRGFDVAFVHGFDDSGPGPVVLRTLRHVCKPACRSELSVSWLDPLADKHGGRPRDRARLAAEAYFVEEGNPLVLLVDDFEALDQESRLLTDALLRACAEQQRHHPAGRGLGVFLCTSDDPPSCVDREDRCQLLCLGDDLARRLLRDLLAPTKIPEPLLDEVLLEAGGVPLRLRRFANALREEWSRVGALPDRVKLLRTPIPEATFDTRKWKHGDPTDRRLVEALRIILRPTSKGELAAALDLPPRQISASLRRLVRSEVIQVIGNRRSARYRLHASFLGGPAIGCSRAVTRLHNRLARYLRERTGKNPRDHENLARHTLAAGHSREGCRTALKAAERLKRKGSFDRAFRLLEAAIAVDLPIEDRLRLAREMSALAEATGDHAAGIRALEPFDDRELALSPQAATPILRCLGIHYHRSGAPEKALKLFKKAQRAADPKHNLADLIFIDSELAEIHTFGGNYVAAEEACRRGLDRLEGLPLQEPFRASMELTLRASLGHLELRRLHLRRAREQLEAALAACRRYGTTANQAAILNNLGIAANQQNDFQAAERYFKEAEKLLLAAGERQGTIKVASNLAIICAKLGKREQAQAQLERAEGILPYFHGRRLEFFVAYARGTVSSLLGDPRGAIQAFEKALPVGRELGDHHMVGYGEVYLAEAHLACGEYRIALRLLRQTAAEARNTAAPLLTRMVNCRLWFLETLLGRPRSAKRSRRMVENTPRTDVELLEAWNDLLIGLCQLLSGEGHTTNIENGRTVFERLGVPFGSRFAHLLSAVAALLQGDRRQIRAGVALLAEGDGSRHQFLAVAEPLARAEALFFLGETHRAQQALGLASGAIVGSPFLELDWRIELLRARVASHDGDIGEARRHLHRSLHTRDLLLQLVPSKTRERFLAHPRFANLRETEERLSGSPRLFYSTRKARPATSHEGIVGRSSAMVRVFQMVERIADQETNILISGETGTGKELIARAVHQKSTRAAGPFLAVHCASLLGEVFESELFGAVAGAYTGAEEDRPGLLETLSGGTLLLDEIGQLSAEAQAKLLQVIESRSFRRLGSVELRHADVRFLASTSSDLEAEVTSGTFRADLYYRLCGVDIALPPLRRRRGDVGPLARHFLERHARRLKVQAPSLSPDARRLLEKHPWPGNVRQLEGTLLRVLVSVSHAEFLTARDLEPYLAERKEVLFNEDLIERYDLQELKRVLERQYLTRLFLKCDGDARRMMAKLGIRRTRFYTWLRRLGLDVHQLRKQL